MKNKLIAVLSVLVNDRQNHSGQINQILTEHGHLIIARLGVNLQRQCVEKCSALITVALEGEKGVIEKLVEKLNTTGSTVKISLFES